LDDEIEVGFYEFYGWYSAISFLAENKVWQIDAVTNLPLVACLNHLAYIVDFNNEKEKELKKQQH
jgi:hypothetical protein